MATLDVFPPPEQVIAKLAAMPGARISPGAVFAVDGCQWPSQSPRFWPTESPHPVRLLRPSF